MRHLLRANPRADKQNAAILLAKSSETFDMVLDAAAVCLVNAQSPMEPRDCSQFTNKGFTVNAQKYFPIFSNLQDGVGASLCYA